MRSMIASWPKWQHKRFLPLSESHTLFRFLARVKLAVRAEMIGASGPQPDDSKSSDNHCDVLHRACLYLSN